MKRHLQVFLGDQLPASADAPLPQAWGVCYTRPNPDGSRKSCVNCVLWVSGSAQCSVHEPSIAAPPTAVCGHHIYGHPMAVWVNHPGIQPLDPTTSGLEQTTDGASCSNCRWFVEGHCTAVVDEMGGAAPVEPLGCCARWEG